MDKKQVALGVLVVVVGLTVLLSNMNVGPIREIASNWWPVFVILAGLLMWWGNPRNVIWPVTVMAIGAIVLINTTNAGNVDIGAIFWPAIIIAVGASLITKSSNNWVREVNNSEEDISAILGGTSSKNSSDDYRGGNVNAVLGGAELDLREATIKKEATLTVSVILGGLELHVPDNVIVKTRATAIMGGFEDNTRPKTEKGPVLYINGTILMGGVEIKR